MRVRLLIPLLLLFGCDRPAEAPRPVTLFAAASLTDVLTDIAARYTEQTGRPVTCNFAATSTLARQIEAGAPADVFVAAHPKWIDYLDERDAIDTDSRTEVAGNTLVVITPIGKPPQGDLREVLLRGRVALGDPAHVPAGVYAKQALASLGLWDEVAERVIGASDVRAALRLVEAGEAQAGIVYATDVRLTPGVQVAHRLPESSHDPIVYEAAVVRGRGVEARDLLRFMSHGQSLAILRAAGFATGADAR